MSEGVSRAPFECVCGFTAGTSFAWEKHLALRNTPYSTVRHTRVTRGLGETGTPKDLGREMHGRDAGVAEMGSSGRPHAEQHLHYPTPKALFRDSPQSKEQLLQYRSSSPSPPYSPNTYSSTAPLSASAPVGSAGMRLEDAARRGDMDRVARLAVEMLRLAQQGDAQSVLDMVVSRGGGGGGASVESLSKGMKRLTVREGAGSGGGGDVKFSSYISAVHQKRDGITIEQVPTGLRDSYSPEPQGRKDALRLLAMTEPLMDAARPNQAEPMTFGVDVGVLKRTIISVAQQATRLTARESRVLEVPSPCYVLGDIHGNLVDLQFFRKTLWPAGPEVTAGDFLFLGDFVDRGKDSIPCIAYIMAMKVLNPNKWWMIRGNHETREVNGNTEHYQDGSFLNQCLVIFGDSDGYAVWEAVNNFFDVLPLACSIDRTIFAVHGGIPRELCQEGSSLDIVRNLECPMRSVHTNEMVYDMLWSDPSSPEQEQSPELDTAGFGLSARGCTCFGERSIDLFLQIHGFKHVFRGHEAQQSGVGVSKGARLTTIFSTSRDHFAADITSTCGCVLVDHDFIHPIVRALPQTHGVGGLKPTYAEQSVEASEVSVTHDAPTSPQHAHHGHVPRTPHQEGGVGVFSDWDQGGGGGGLWGSRTYPPQEGESVTPPPRRTAWGDERLHQQWLGAGR